jgi:DNA-binding NarL/FixJ family response regulator
MKTSIVIVDDHVLIAKALQSIISNFNPFEVLYECENGKELQAKFSQESNIPNIVLLDISMPVMDGFETAKWLKDNHPDVLVMALSMQDDEFSLIKMIQNGAKSYLLKNAHPAELENALNTLVKNGYYYPDWASNKLFVNINKNALSGDSQISFNEREKEFLRYTVTELTYKEIADKMFCSPRTVEGYRDILCEKLALKTRVGLAVFAMKNGFM